MKLSEEYEKPVVSVIIFHPAVASCVVVPLNNGVKPPIYVAEFHASRPVKVAAGVVLIYTFVGFVRAV